MVRARDRSRRSMVEGLCGGDGYIEKEGSLMKSERIFDLRTLVLMGFSLAMLVIFTSPVLVKDIASAQCPDDATFTTDFQLEDCTFTATGNNTYFSLNPGYQQVLEGEEDGTTIRNEITVLNQTKVVDGVTTRVVEEREYENDVLIEVSENFFTICQETNSVFYFGEDSSVCDVDETGGFAVDNDDECANGDEPDHGGSWQAGKKNAQPGLMMPGIFLLGSKYYQEQAPKAALDRAEHVAMGQHIITPAGNFQNCVEVHESNPLDEPPVCAGGDVKNYCPGIGLVVDEDFELVETTGNFFAP